MSTVKERPADKLWSVMHVLGEEEDNQSTVYIYAANIEAKFASVLIRVLNASAPLSSLGHVKRVRRQKHQGGFELSIILCLAYKCVGDVWSKIPPEISEVVEEYGLQPFIAMVSKKAASSREEWEAQCRIWPTSFHPNSVITHMKIQLQEDEVENVCKYMRAAIKESNLACMAGQPANGAVIVDPAFGCIISSGHDETGGWLDAACGRCSLNTSIQDSAIENAGASVISKMPLANAKETEGTVQRSKPFQEVSWHPLRHAVMVAIERAAARDYKSFTSGQDELCSGQRFEHNAANELSEEGYNDVSTKRPRWTTIPENDEKDAMCITKFNVSQPYLCTGFDAYITREPCSMCAMALLHQRVRRVFYGISNPIVGALGSVHKLHEQPNLNHHYTVFKVFLTEDDLVY